MLETDVCCATCTEKLNVFKGGYARAEMARAFIESTEHRSRFGI
ncbi:MAG TPA: hypothetical protein VEX60_06515 [Pyrinomonadaceae bacterium]|nr:hypothetical protein [Pyrinomonadaceae bacterium]